MTLDANNSVNQLISILQTDITYKVDKDTFEQALEAKLDKEEFYSKMNDSPVNEDAFKKVGGILTP